MIGFNSKEEYFEYLDELRDSGVTNMFGAGAYLEDEFDLSKNDARDILFEWMDSFGKTRSPAAQ